MMTRKVVGILVGVLIVLALGVSILPTVQKQFEPCVLHAETSMVSRDTPVGRATNWSSDSLAIRSRDADDWDEVSVMIKGVETVDGRRSTTASYSSSKPVVAAGKLATFNLNTFATAKGQRWVSLTMKPTDIEIEARLRGRACRYEGRID